MYVCMFNIQMYVYVSQCKKIIADNPVACAEFLNAYLAAFADIFLGWPMDSDSQQKANCLFGEILAYYYKYESSTRGGIHAHGQLIQRFLQAQFLRDLVMNKNGDDMFINKLYSFFEATMCAFFPVPEKPLAHSPAHFSPLFTSGNNVVVNKPFTSCRRI